MGRSDMTVMIVPLRCINFGKFSFCSRCARGIGIPGLKFCSPARHLLATNTSWVGFQAWQLWLFQVPWFLPVLQVVQSVRY